MSKLQNFLLTLTTWYQNNKRSLPFRDVKDPYKVWVSEVLLQQTQMSRGVAYYERFIERFPSVQELSKANWKEFLPYFQGLGYYNRGRNMLKAAKVIVEEYKGIFPDDKKKLLKLPGVGSYIADAILSFAYDQRSIPLDTNIKRVLGRVFLGTFKLEENTKEGKKVLDQITEAYRKVPSSEINQAMMDLASAICLSGRPLCIFCPLQKICLYYEKEQPHLVQPQKRVKEKYTASHAFALIMVGKKVLLHKNKLLGGVVQKGDARGFLKGLAEQNLGLTISVRPAFKSWISDGTKYALHRCYILLGEEKIEGMKLVAFEEAEALVLGIKPLKSLILDP